MGKDFRVGLMTGVVLAGAALIWVATRPSLSPRARVPQSAQAAHEVGQVSKPPLPWEESEVAEADKPQASPREPRLAQEIPQQIRSVSPPLLPSNPAPSSSAPAPVAGGGASSIVRAKQDSPPPTGDLTIYETSEPIKTTRFHIVRKGESLSSIASQYYGTSGQWRKVFAANQKSIKDPNKVAPGTKLIIPD